MKHVFKKVFVATVLVYISFTILVHSAFAIEVSVQSTRHSFLENNSLVFTVSVDPEGQSFNALEGVLEFPASFIIDSVSLMNSVVHTWIVDPRIATSSAYVPWALIIPGGFSGTQSPFYKGSKPGLLFTVYGHTNKAGDFIIYSKSLRALKNDGLGTEIRVKESSLSGSVPSNNFESIPNQYLSLSRATSTNQINTIFEKSTLTQNLWLMTFYSQNEDLVHTYSVAEISRPETLSIDDKRWQITSSPYVLRDQSRSSFIYIQEKHLDGTVYYSVIAPQQRMSHYFILGILSVITYLVFRFIYKNHVSKK